MIAAVGSRKARGKRLSLCSHCRLLSKMLDSLGDHCVRTGNYCPPRCYFPTSHLRRSSLLAKRQTFYLIRVLEVPALHPHTSDFHYQLILPHSSQISDGLAARVSGWWAHAKPPLLAAAATCSE